jgi:hypothetical protein
MSLIHGCPYGGMNPQRNSMRFGLTVLGFHMKKIKLTSKQKRQEAEILEKTAIKLIQKSVELKRASRSRSSKKKAPKPKVA